MNQYLGYFFTNNEGIYNYEKLRINRENKNKNRAQIVREMLCLKCLEDISYGKENA